MQSARVDETAVRFRAKIMGREELAATPRHDLLPSKTIREFWVSFQAFCKAPNLAISRPACPPSGHESATYARL